MDYAPNAHGCMGRGVSQLFSSFLALRQQSGLRMMTEYFRDYLIFL